MKYTLLFFFLTSISIFNEPLSWRSDFKLSWNEFKGSPKLDSGAVAVTASGITFSFNVKTTNDKIVDFDTEVEAQFHPNNSWYLKEKVNTYILEHEQLHFDITELHVRRLRKAISELSVNPNIKNQLKALHIEANEALRAMQNQYDFESENSINYEAQLKWDRLIELELEKYEDFSSD